MSERPLISFLLFAYNQERFIREAVAGAFAQTYSPLEIILSDDCSRDRTFDIMQDMAAAYHGPHRIMLNRNPKNLGIGNHVNALVKLSRGSLIVTAAGDDVSIPHRTQASYEFWLQGNGVIKSLFSNALVIDEKGSGQGPLFAKLIDFSEDMSQFVAVGNCWVAGCTHCFSRELFERFPPLPAGIIHEDRAIPFRAILLGKIGYTPQQLIHYRRHSTNTFMAIDKRVAHKVFRSKCADLMSWLSDLELINIPEKAKVRR